MIKEDFEEYKRKTEKVLSVLARCFENPNCIIHEGNTELMYRKYVDEGETFYITERGVDFEFSKLEYIVNFLIGGVI